MISSWVTLRILVSGTKVIAEPGASKFNHSFKETEEGTELYLPKGFWEPKEGITEGRFRGDGNTYSALNVEQCEAYRVRVETSLPSQVTESKSSSNEIRQLFVNIDDEKYTVEFLKSHYTVQVDRSFRRAFKRRLQQFWYRTSPLDLDITATVKEAQTYGDRCYAILKNGRRFIDSSLLKPKWDELCKSVITVIWATGLGTFDVTTTNEMEIWRKIEEGEAERNKRIREAVREALRQPNPNPS
ncbi:hypothetical protein DFH06DRAFT_1148857 [Mycena polygramma]|nr:hypothetical protein DFH06DRAFT_1148857 [Mycena polygramma]